MPERVALSRITIGEGKDGKDRRMIMPGERFNVSNEQAAEIDAIDPPIAADPRRLDAEARRPVSEADEDADAVRRIAEPERPSPVPARASGNGNTTREKPAEEEL